MSNRIETESYVIEKMKILHLGCGPKRIDFATNIDVRPLPNVDEVVDLSVLPWKWEDNSIDGIYMFHVIEHFPDIKQILLECRRILKKGGFLYLAVPHASCVSSIGCMGHYRTFSYDTLRAYLSEPFYMFEDPIFKTTYQRINWWYRDGCDSNVPKIIQFFLKPVNLVLTYLANLSPQVCENLWCYWVGGFREVIWTGEKI